MALATISNIPLPSSWRETAPSLHAHTHLEILEFSSKSLKTRDAVWSHLHDVAVGSRSWLIGSQELGMQHWRSFREVPFLAHSPALIVL